MPTARDALMVAITSYDDSGLAQLRTPASEIDALGEALLAGFSLRKIMDGTPGEVQAEINAFFADREPDDVLLLHIACHAILTPDGLVLATPAASRTDPVPGSVPADAVAKALAATASEHVVVVLDCCFSGSARGAVDLTGLSEHAQVFLSATAGVEYLLDQGMIRGRGMPSKLTPELAAALRAGLTAAQLATLPAEVSVVREPDLVIADATDQPAPQPAAVVAKPARTTGDWAMRVFYAGIVVLLLAFVGSFATSWVRFPEWYYTGLDALTWLVLAGFALVAVGGVVSVAAFFARRRRFRK